MNNQGCSKCGNTGLHACTGEPARAWTSEERERVKNAFKAIAESERIEKERFTFLKFRVIDK